MKFNYKGPLEVAGSATQQSLRSTALYYATLLATPQHHVSFSSKVMSHNQFTARLCAFYKFLSSLESILDVLNV